MPLYLRAQVSNEEKAPDTLKVEEHSPKKATILSAALPGLGQAYNKKYWKIPIIYGAAGTLLYFARVNHNKYVDFKQQYIYRIDDDPNTVDDFPNASPEQLRDAVDFYRRNRDLNYIFVAGVYVLNLIDAAVDAHLYSFDVSDDLSMSVQPDLMFTSNIPVPNIPAFSVTLRW